MSVTTSRTLSLDELFAAGDGERRFARLRSELDVQSFGIGAVRAVEPGPLLNEHDELGPGSDRQERLWIVLSGHAVFSVDGEELDAPAGTVVYVRDPAAKRSAVAHEAGTTIAGIGGRPGEPYRVPPGEALAEYFPLHEAKDYEGAASVAREVLGEYPGNGLALYNLACAEALQGDGDAALAHLRDALDAAPVLVDNAKEDEDFTSIREDPRFAALVA